MRLAAPVITLAVLAVSAGCGPANDSASGIGPISDAPLRVPESLRDTRFSSADLERGELLSFACQACHTLREGEPHQTGPNLYGILGRTAGTQEGFEYTDGLRASGIVWSVETIEAWLAAPNDYVPGTTMVFAGYADPDDRRDLIAYLIAVTSRVPGL
jgi:cytochrome c